MCFHTKLSADKQTIEERFNAKFEAMDYKSQLRINGFSFPKTPIITSVDPTSIQYYSWGLLPSWTRDLNFRTNTLNARLESLTEKPSFKSYLNNRCLILADGFFEWQWLDSKGKNKQQYEITLEDNKPFAFAGIYSAWMDKTGEVLNTYSIITTEANQLMAEIHNTKKRMPLILTPTSEQLWLTDQNILEFVKPEVKLKAVKI